MKIFAHKYLNANKRLIAYLRNISQNKISFKEPYTKYKYNVVNYILYDKKKLITISLKSNGKH